MKFLFAADLDGTLLPNTGKPGAPGCLERTRALLQDLRERDIPVCYVTGRHLDLACEGIGSFQLPPPTHWICNVGTEIYGEDGEPDLEWAALLGPPLEHDRLREALAAITGLSLQEAEKQGRHKLSFYYPSPACPALCQEIVQRSGSEERGMQLVSSTEESTGRALLDLIPTLAGKRHAVAYMAARHDIRLEDTFFAGDSGNDLDVLLSGVRGTLVGNTPEVVTAEWLNSQQPAARCYFARAYYGDGVIEGLKHYQLWSPADTAGTLERTGS